MYVSIFESGEKGATEALSIELAEAVSDQFNLSRGVDTVTVWQAFAVVRVNQKALGQRSFELTFNNE